MFLFLQVTLLLVAPDIEPVSSSGGLDDLVADLVNAAGDDPEGMEDKAPLVMFCLNRRRLGRACLRKVPISVVAVMNYQGTEVGGRRVVEPQAPFFVSQRNVFFTSVIFCPLGQFQEDVSSTTGAEGLLPGQN